MRPSDVRRRRARGARNVGKQDDFNYSVALVCCGLGEKDEAFAWLEKALARREAAALYVNVGPEWDSLRSDPRFADLVRRIGLSN